MQNNRLLKHLLTNAKIIKYFNADKYVSVIIMYCYSLTRLFIKNTEPSENNKANNPHRLLALFIQSFRLVITRPN